MCGICGVIGTNDKTLAKKMASALSHRGPDQQGFFTTKNVDFGHRRLSVIDIATGKQPIHNKDESAWIIFNGEIYNYKDLKKRIEDKYEFYTNSDTEVILHLYEDLGISFLRELNGVFALAIYDDKKKIVILARDRLGTKPLYYWNSKGKFVFSSELKSLLKEPLLKRELDAERIKEYMQFGFISSPNTILKDVYKVSPGEFIIFDLKTKKIRKELYWDFNFKEKPGSLSNYKENFYENFTSSVKDQLMSEVPLGVYLSGGLDSSSIVAAMRQSYPESKIKTFSVGFGSKEVVNELTYAKDVAEHFSTEHQDITLSHNSVRKFPEVIYSLDEPINNLSSIPLYFMAQEASKKVKVILTGNGSDELFAGYFQHRFMKFSLTNKNLLKAGLPFLSIKNKIKPNRKTIFLEQFIKKIDNPAEAYKLLKYPEPEKVLFQEKYLPLKSDESIRKILNMPFSKLNNLTLIELKKLLPENYLMVDDKINMRFSIESRVPFLDNKMVELSEILPDKLKTNYLRGKLILRATMKDHLPNSVITRKKYGFTAPATLWFKENIKEINGLFSDKSPLDKFLNKVELVKRTSSGKTNDINLAWKVLVLDIWARQYISGQKVKF